MSSADDLISKLEGIEASTFANERERVRARDALFEALRKVQSPWDIAWDHNWVNGATNAAIKTLIDAGVFKKWAEAGWEPKNCEELASTTGADPVLIRRFTRHLAGQNLVIEVAEDTYSPTPWAKQLVIDPALASTYGGFYHELNNPMFRTLPSYLKSTGFKNPSDMSDGNLQFWMPGSNLFHYIGTNPLLTSDFNDAMEVHSRYNLLPWVEVYPTDSLVADAKTGRAVVVDIGGGKGHDLEKFRAVHPDIAAGSLVLQDLPDVLKEVKAPSDAITVQPYDFFTPQPSAGARVYFMHNVLHDWTDDKAVQILKIVAEAMEKGYSKLLIHESLVTSLKPLARVTTSDITMMACLSAKERSEQDWRDLIDAAGLKLVKIWRPPQSVESIIEVELGP